MTSISRSRGLALADSIMGSAFEMSGAEFIVARLVSKRFRLAVDFARCHGVIPALACPATSEVKPSPGGGKTSISRSRGLKMKLSINGLNGVEEL